MDERMILMGVVGRPHGVRGLVRVTAYGADPAALADYPLADAAGRRFALAWVSDGIAQLSEAAPGGWRKIGGRDEAERLTNTELFVPRAALPAAKDDEFYIADLVGLSARDGAAQIIGTIAAVHDFGGGTSLEIAPGAVLVPFTRAAVPVVDVAGGFVEVRPPVEIAP